MKRDVDNFADRSFDLLIVGGGIVGACIARDASMRGLSVALIEQDDFCSGTSHNSLKIVHSGIRYLQHLDVRRIRESIQELNIWMHIAPHLVQPQKFIIPTQGWLTRGPAALQTALVLHRLLGIGHNNRDHSLTRKLPLPRVRGRSALADHVPGLPMSGLTGMATWYDGLMLGADRIVLECLQDAVERNAVVANHVSARSLLTSDGDVHGVVALDRVTNNELEIRAKLTVIAGGPWTQEFLRTSLPPEACASVPPLARNINIVTRKLFYEFGVGIPSRHSSDAVLGSEQRLFFVAPWKNVSAIGTTHFPYDGTAKNYAINEAEILEFIAEINESYPPAELEPDDILYVYGGLTPAKEGSVRGEVGRSRKSLIIDHSDQGNVGGLISAIGVTYSSARLLAERAVSLAQRKLGLGTKTDLSRTSLLPGARGMPPLATESYSKALDDPIADLLLPYGCRPPKIAEKDLNSFADVHSACVRHAVRNEMAITLDDVLLRRMDLAERGLMTRNLVESSARIMAEELGWDEPKAQQAIDDSLLRIRYLGNKDKARQPDYHVRNIKPVS